MRNLLITTVLTCQSAKVSTENEDTAIGLFSDNDGDGYNQTEDCSDLNPSIYPGAEELCDEQDNNCNGEIDEGLISTYYEDNDGDGFGTNVGTIEACEAPEGYSEADGDCDDSNDSVYPDAPEQCDEIDNNCNNEVDEDLQTI